MKKRYIVLTALTLLAMSFIFAGCGGQEKTADSQDTNTESGYIDVDSVDGENGDSYDKYNETNATTTENNSSEGSQSQTGDNADSTASGNTSTSNSNSSGSGSGNTATNNVTDEYKTSPVPEGKPQPVEPQDVTVSTTKELTCTIYIECAKIFDNMEDFNEDKMSVLPSDGVILAKTTVTFKEGESVFDVLKSQTKANSIHLEFKDTPGYNSSYIEGIGNLYELDCGALSGWMYSVNGWFPNYGSSRYQVQDGDVIEWHYTCDLGKDFGQSGMNR